MPQCDDQTYLLVGTVTKDLLPDDNFSIGGTITYAGTMAQRLGWQPVIVTAAASDFTPPPALSDADWHILPSPHTTTFRNEYSPQGRRQTVGPIARTIRPNDIPVNCYQTPIVHICPLAWDVDLEVMELFRAKLPGKAKTSGKSPSNLLATTPQGWLRQWDEGGVVSPGDWRQLCDILAEFHLVVLSDEDIGRNLAAVEALAAWSPVLALTQGAKGCALFHRGETFSVPPRPANPLVLTGAGDVFAAAFFIRYYETDNLHQAAYFANVAASMAIERPGPADLPCREEIEAYIAANGE